MVRELLDAGVDRAKRDANNLTPLQLARAEGNENIVSMLGGRVTRSIEKSSDGIIDAMTLGRIYDYSNT